MDCIKYSIFRLRTINIAELIFNSQWINNILLYRIGFNSLIL